MSRYEFDLVLFGLELEAAERELAGFEERVDDITLAEHGGVGRAAVEREAPSLGAAIRTAVADVEAIPGVRVVRVEPDDYVSRREIASRIGTSRSYVSQLASGARGPGGFPPPAFESGTVALWRWSDLAEWLGAAGLRPPDGDPRHSAVIGAANALLEARRAVARLSEDERQSLTAMVS